MRVAVVGHIGGGEVVRAEGAQSIRDLCFRTHASAALQPLVCGPSFLALLERFPRGELPPETACAIVDVLTPPASGLARLSRLRFDLDDEVFRWCADAGEGGDEAFAPWRAALLARLLGRHGPRFEIVYSRREPAGKPIDVDELPWRDIDGGRKHLAGIVATSLPRRLAHARDLREQWWLHDGPPPEPLAREDVKQEEYRRKAELLFAQAEHDCFSGRHQSAQMHVKLASIYDPNAKRYQRAVEALAI